MQVAEELCRPGPARLDLLHVVPRIPKELRDVLFPLAGLGEDEVALYEELRQHAGKELERSLRLGARHKAVGKGEGGLDLCVPSSRLGLVEALTERLSASEAQLIVMGATGEGGAWPGGVSGLAQRVAGVSSRPVLWAREAAGAKVGRVVVALDLSESSARVWRVGLGVSLLLGVPVDAVVVLPDHERDDVRGILAGAGPKVDRKLVRRAGRKGAEEALAQLESEVEVPFSLMDRYKAQERARHVLWGDCAEELVQFLGGKEDALVVLGVSGQRQAKLARRVGRSAVAVAGNAGCHALLVP